MIFDSPLTRTKRPASGNTDSDLDDRMATKPPDITGDLAAIDRALADAKAAKQQKQKRSRGCGCF